MQDFVQEVFRVRGLLTLYAQIRDRDYVAVNSRIVDPCSAVDRRLAARVRLMRPVELPTDERMAGAMALLRLKELAEASFSLAPDSVIALADQCLAEELSESLARVRIRVVPGFDPPSGFEPEDRGTLSSLAASRYKMRGAWYCPDLLSAIYLQLYLLATRNTRMRFCEACHSPLPAKPKHKRFCNDSCRSAGRPK